MTELEWDKHTTPYSGQLQRSIAVNVSPSSLVVRQPCYCSISSVSFESKACKNAHRCQKESTSDFLVVNGNAYALLVRIDVDVLALRYFDIIAQHRFPNLLPTTMNHHDLTMSR